MGCPKVTIVFLSDRSARPFGTKKVPKSIRQIMPVNILRYIVKSPFLEIRASKFIYPRNSVRVIEKHARYQTASKSTAEKMRHFNDLNRLCIFLKQRLYRRVTLPWQRRRIRDAKFQGSTGVANAIRRERGC